MAIFSYINSVTTITFIQTTSLPVYYFPGIIPSGVFPKGHNYFLGSLCFILMYCSPENIPICECDYFPTSTLTLSFIILLFQIGMN